MNNGKKQDEEVEKSTLQNNQSDVYDKCVVAAYANVAQLQFQTGIRYLQAKVDGKKLVKVNEDSITDLYTVENLKKCSNLIELTEKIFPFLKLLNNK